MTDGGRLKVGFLIRGLFDFTRGLQNGRASQHHSVTGLLVLGLKRICSGLKTATWRRSSAGGRLNHEVIGKRNARSNNTIINSLCLSTARALRCLILRVQVRRWRVKATGTFAVPLKPDILFAESPVTVTPAGTLWECILMVRTSGNRAEQTFSTHSSMRSTYGASARRSCA